MAKILVVHHSPTDKARFIADTVLDAARSAAAEANSTLEIDPDHQDAVVVIERAALDPDAQELRGADAIILGTTANFGYISGALKHYFDSVFNDVAEEKSGLPMSWWIRGGYDTTGAEKAMRSITTGLGWELAAEPIEFTGDPAERVEALRAMAETVVGAALASI